MIFDLLLKAVNFGAWFTLIFSILALFYLIFTGGR